MTTKSHTNTKNQAVRIATVAIFYPLSFLLFTKPLPIADPQIIQPIALTLIVGGSIISFSVVLSYAIKNEKEEEISLVIIAILVITMIIGCCIYWMATNYTIISSVKEYLLTSGPIVCIMFGLLIIYETLTVFMQQKT